MSDTALRAQLADFLDWKQAHVGFEDAVKGVEPKMRGAVPSGFAHSIWEVVEHMRIAQRDILDFCQNPDYKESLKWPEDYWPQSRGPKNATAWDRSLAGFRRDRSAMQRLAADRKVDLYAKIPHGTGQTYLREVLLVADHGAYHVARIVDIRRALGIWTS